MSNVHRFNPRRKPPPPRKRLPFARSAWLPLVLILVAAILLFVLGAGGSGAALGALGVVLAGAWLDGRA